MDLPTVTNPFRYPIDQILLMNHLAYREGLIVHAAGLAMQGEGLLFAGPSGAGKSTLARLLSQSGEVIRILSDDRIILRKTDGIYRTYGTPWPGEAGFAENGSAPVKGIFFPTKSDTNHLIPLAPAEAARRLFPVLSCPWYDRRRLPLVLTTSEDLLARIPCFEFRFRANQGAVAVLTSFIERVL